ncbi:hypothetical protein [Bacillus manliponensis]|uniref:hypothetical protein n=1 Tax=Bacillus manliponensis TaxID=574376 RepID=UPI000B2BD330|nr:hypothetical protein [Bacillus manliponensis]
MDKLWEVISNMVKNGEMNQSGLALVESSLNPEQYAALEEHILRGNNGRIGWL